METKKLIASKDVKFMEDERPNDLAVFDGFKGTRAISGLSSGDLEASTPSTKIHLPLLFQNRLMRRASHLHEFENRQNTTA
jgi:hypothetical protein